MKLKPYPTYKGSGVEWLDKVPTHWSVIPFKLMLDIQNGSDYKHVEVDDGYPVIGSGGLFTYASEYLYDGESVLLGRKGTIDKPLYIRDKFWTVDTMYWSKITPGTHGKFAYYAALTIPFDYYSTSTALPSMTKSALNAHLVACPELCEQTSIANFLDRETANLDTLIAKQEKLIELLQEKRKAIISHSVTKGLNPHAKMKDSGLAWLGEVPSHWVITRLKYLGDAIIGLTYDPDEVVAEGEGTLVLRSSNIQQGAVSFEDNVFVNKVIPEKLITKIGDILICSRNGSRKLIGKNITIDENTYGLSFGAFMTIFRTEYYRYVSCILNSSLFEFQAGSFLTSTVNQLTTGNLNSFEVPFPPEDEQIKISEYINHQTNKIDSLIEKAKRSIELANEHRIALISAAVTGKIDVREAA